MRVLWRKILYFSACSLHSGEQHHTALPCRKADVPAGNAFGYKFLIFCGIIKLIVQNMRKY